MTNSKQQHFSIPLQSGLAITDGQNPALSIRYSRRSGIVRDRGRLGTLE